MSRYRAAIFDLDGVLVDSAVAHFAAWKRIADALGIAFTQHDNEQLKGIDRMGSLDRILSLGSLSLERHEREAWAARKNAHYLEAVGAMGPGDQLVGAAQLVADARAAGLRCAVASASRNAPLLLSRVGLADAFDFVADPEKAGAPKPAPDIFLACATALGAAPERCIGFEDAAAGIAAIRAAGMTAIGIGDAASLAGAHHVFPTTAAVPLAALLAGQV